MTLKVGSLCSGYGGIEIALSSVLEADLEWFAEFEDAPAKVMAHHHPGVPNLRDLTKINWGTVAPVDVLTAGFPCQPFSHAGKRLGANDERHLWPHIAKAIDVLRPRLALLENVRGLLSAQGEPDPAWVADLANRAARWQGIVYHVIQPKIRKARRRGQPDRIARLEADTVRLLEQQRVAMDTVRRARSRLVRAIGVVARDLANIGYVMRWYGLRAADVGAAHGRFRVFLFATPADAESTGAWGHERGLRAVAERGGHGRQETKDVLTPLPTPAVNDNRDKVRAILDERSTPAANGCRVWTGWTNDAQTPYGRFSIGNQKVYAHRAAYELRHGGIPEGYEIDHLCQNTLCVHPNHLEAVTTEENRDRVMRRRTHCKRGHEFTEENTFWVRPGARACRTCRAWQDKVQKARKKGAPEPEPPLLPTPVTNDMGAGKTVDEWDAWTDRMKTAHGNGNGHGKSLAIEAQRLLPTPTVRQPNRWGQYAAAIARAEQAIGRPAPPPTEIGPKGTPRLSARFVEFLMMLPEGWVTDVTGLTRNDELKMLGNGVVPAQCAAALRAFLWDAYGIGAAA